MIVQEKYRSPPPIYNPIEFFTDEQLVAERGNPFLFDIECFQNFFLIAFKSYVSGRVVLFELSETEQLNKDKLRWIAENMLLVGFNSRNYDLPMLWASMYNLQNEALLNLSNEIIRLQTPIGKLERKYKFLIHDSNNIDLQEIAPSAASFCSLKHYGARMHVQTIQDMPLEINSSLSEEQKWQIRLYCINDLDITGWLKCRLKAAIDLRQEMGFTYGIDLRSLSDAQIAEKVIGNEIEKITCVHPRRPILPQGMIFQFKNPEYIRFYSPELQELHSKIIDTVFMLDGDGKIKVLTDKMVVVSATNLWSVKVGNSTYRLGIGGLHSSEQKQTFFSDEKHILLDRDVASYYPQIILNQGLYPEHIGPEFLNVYKDIVSRRLQAKVDKDKTTAESLKICINGCFGKLGSKWSIFFSPNLLAQVTISGQLSLLMLIEMLEWCQISVVSANTDGIVIRCPASRLIDAQTVVEQWEGITGFVTEETRYASIHSRDVNNYIAIGAEGTIKAKGAYVNELSMKDRNRESLTKNPNGSICSEAVMRFLQTCREPHPITIEQTVMGCKDITKFLFVRRVNGGAVKDGQYIGKIVRWYMRFGEFGAIKYLEANVSGSKNVVSESTGSYPIMDLRNVPTDIDYNYYIRKAHSILRDVGFYKSGMQLMLF